MQFQRFTKTLFKQLVVRRYTCTQCADDVQLQFLAVRPINLHRPKKIINYKKKTLRYYRREELVFALLTVCFYNTLQRHTPRQTPARPPVSLQCFHVIVWEIWLDKSSKLLRDDLMTDTDTGVGLKFRNSPFLAVVRFPRTPTETILHIVLKLQVNHDCLHGREASTTFCGKVKYFKWVNCT